MAGRRLTLFYVVLLVAVAAVATLVLSAGAKEEAEPAIAGGYDVTEGNACLGDTFDVRQSGQFVSVQRADASGAGKLRFENGELKGDLTCAEGGKQPLDATVKDGVIAGTIGDEAFNADFAREPPDAGAQKPAPPGAVSGEYKLVPRSACLGGKVELTGSSKALELEGQGRPRGARLRRCGQAHRHRHLRRQATRPS